MDLHLKGKTALVTGSTAGIGLEIGRKLAAEGADVIVTGREQTKLDQAIDVIRRSGGGTVRGVVADAAATEGAADLLKAAPEVDVLINNLGIYEIKPFGEITDDDWRRYFEINVLSGARLARQYFPRHAEAQLGPDRLHLQRIRFGHARRDGPLWHDQNSAARRFARSRRLDQGHERDRQLRFAGSNTL